MAEIEVSPEEIATHIQIIKEGQDANAFESAEKLAKIGGESVVGQLVVLLSSENYDTVYLAASALSKCKDNSLAIAQVFDLIKSGEQPFLKGILTEALEGFDCSEYFIELLKLYLFGSFKVSAMAKVILDEQEFAITPRVIRKAEKHLKHYEHNVKMGEDVSVKKSEVESMLTIMKELFEGDDEGLVENED